MATRIRKKSRAPIEIERLPIRLLAEESWVITRPFFPGGETRVRNVMRRVGRLSEKQVEKTLAQVRESFGHRHRKLDAVFLEHYEAAAKLCNGRNSLSESRRLLIGSYFTMEYSIASAALFNPSIVPHPDQGDLPAHSKRFIMSLRATGEGHVSSIIFRTGVIRADHSIQIDPASPYSHRARVVPDRKYDKSIFRRKLMELSIDKSAVNTVMDGMPEWFTLVELEHAINQVQNAHPELLQKEETAQGMRWLARENYQIKLPDDAGISEVVLFPQSDNESMGIEDVRLVPFVEDDGTITYFGTYSAFNGFRVLPQLLETSDFRNFSIHTLNGACAQNKGMALFPRRIDGHYCMCSRIDGERLFIMYSDIIHFWEDAEVLHAPKHAWEFMHIGNCGSPLETPEGWLLLTHGVGPMRRYCIGAMLLDRDDPLRVVGHLNEPLIMPTDEEREGYVPNVVYTCGALIHDDDLYVPFAISDTVTAMARVRLDQLLDQLVK